MANNIRIERPNSVIKVNISSVDSAVKVKAATAIQAFVTKIKEKHLS